MKFRNVIAWKFRDRIELKPMKWYVKYYVRWMNFILLCLDEVICQVLCLDEWILFWIDEWILFYFEVLLNMLEYVSIISRLPYMSRILFWSIAKHVRILFWSIAKHVRICQALCLDYLRYLEFYFEVLLNMLEFYFEVLLNMLEYVKYYV
jgi:hypothetical protein